MSSTDVTDIKTEAAASDTAVKADTGKPRLDLIAPEVPMALGEVLRFGAAKYAERNWEKGMSWGRVYAAVQRHLHSWAAGEDNDPESGLPHLWHALTGLHFLVAYEGRGVGLDDRSPYAREAYNSDNDDEVTEDVQPVELTCGLNEAPLAPGVEIDADETPDEYGTGSPLWVDRSDVDRRPKVNGETLYVDRDGGIADKETQARLHDYWVMYNGATRR